MFVAPVFEHITREGIVRIRTTILTIVLALLLTTTTQAKQELRQSETKTIHIHLEKTPKKHFSSKEDVRNFTTESKEEQTAALVAEDWNQLDKIARYYIQSCGGGDCDAKSIASAFNNISIANFEMLRFSEALESANSCIEAFYVTPGCHFLKTKALLEMGRISEAQTSFRITEKLVKHCLSKNESELKAAPDSSHRNLYLSEKNLYESVQGALQRLKAQLFRD